jgi:hypothetical protein
MWFTENPWPPIFLLGLVALCLFVAWIPQKRGIWLAGSLAALLGCGAVYVGEQAVVTDGEKVEAKIRKLVSDFQEKNREAVLGAFSKQAVKWRETAEKALAEVDIEKDLVVKDMSVELFNEKSQAVARFRANGTVSHKKGISAYHPSRWELRWQKEGNDWKIVEVVRLHPFKDEQKEIFAP